MNPLPLFLIIVTLPLLLGGCGEKIVTVEELEVREGIYYLRGSNIPFTDTYMTFHENGNKKKKIRFKDGKPNGIAITWNENGQKLRETNFKDGKDDGIVVQWHDNGQKKDEGNYKDGVMDGLWVWWHENGQKKAEGKFKKGRVIEGTQNYWDIKGEEVDSLEEAEAE